ncbi:uncharacterized protein [Henckelia pumila]|uniref:uncharacterized protein n=1 Tax=Henckelia pumila TaxID=405737 RepID=UPI003C6DD3B5
MLDAAANGCLFRKTPAEAWEIIGNMAESNIGWPDVKREKKAGVLEVDALMTLNAKIDALTHQVALMKTAPVNQAQGNMQQDQQLFEVEVVNFMGNQGRQPYNSNNSYSQNWQPKQEEKKPSFEEIMMKYMSGTEARLQNQESMLQKLEIQMGQIATQLSTRPVGVLPSNTEPNPKGMNAIMVVTRSQSEQFEKQPEEEKAMEGPKIDEEKEEVRAEKSSTTGKKGKTSKFEVNENVDLSTLTFPHRAKQLLFDSQFKNFLEIFKKLHINIPFADALAQMPRYAKFLKNLLKNKKKLTDLTQVTVNEECSTVLQKKLPTKFQDPGSFSIPCHIGSLSFDNVLCDL